MHVLAAESQPRRWEELDSGLDGIDRQRRLEAVLFLSPGGISSRKAAKLAGLADATEARTLIRRLNDSYDAAGRAFRIAEVAGGFAMMTRSGFAPWLQRLSYLPRQTRLGQSAIETLAIVAYRQPVIRANIEAIRGVGCSEVLKQLMELDLVRITGRSEDLGRPYLYGTTRRFLQMFGLRSADRLPRIDWVNEVGSIDTTSPQLAGTGSETKESMVKKSLTGIALLEDEATLEVQRLATQRQVRPASAVDEDDDFVEEQDDEVVDDEVVDDDEDDEDWVDDDEEGLDDDEDLDDDDEEEAEAVEDEVDDTEDGEWEEVDDDDDEDWEDDDEDEDDDDDDWDEDDEEDDDEEWD